MKKQILTVGMICAAAFALTNCDKQSTDPQPATEGTPFEIIASTVDIKTANDGLKTEWTEKDSLNVFHAVTGTSNYGTNDKFTWTGTDNKFSGELTEALESESYDWYALYPYNSHIETPGERTDGYTYIGHSKGVNQQGNNSTAHLCKTLCPLYGVAKGVDSNTSVNLTLKHLASVVKIVVKNSNDADLTVSSITFTAEEDIVGSYFIDITKSPVVYTPSADKYVYKTEVLNVKNGTPIAKDESAEFYIPIKPFTAASGSTLKISVNGYEKPLTMPKDITFEAGQIKAVAFVYNKEETPTPEPSDYVAKFVASGIGSGYGAHENVASNGNNWTVTFGQQTYVGTNSSKKANCKLGSTYEKVGTPCGYSADQTQVAAVISESKFSNVSKVVVDGDKDKYNPEKISLVYSVDGTSYTLIETKDYAKSNEFSFDKIADAYYAVVLYYSGTSFMRTNNLAITFYE